MGWTFGEISPMLSDEIPISDEFLEYMSEVKAKIKTPPSSKESEMMVLGCMLTSINALNVSAGILNEEDFYYNEHKLVFRVLKDAYKKDQP